ncbi:TonB-dependent receptor [Lacibacter sp. MH-610]|uniref:TonB-dependent receptor n=1 Tax=Lacibacter sp. MH-610 TaxID=3020883 RepID=UPI003891781E
MKQILFIITMLLSSFITSAQNNFQTVKGTVLDKISEKPLAGATVTIEALNISSVTDANGNFQLKNVPSGRISISITFSGYQTATIPEILVTTGKEVIVDVSLEQNITSLNEVVIKGSKIKKGNVNNEFAGSSARSFSIEEVTRYAGGRNDPSKLVSNFAGVISNNDSRNDIVVRGNSPAGVLWRIEGLPAPSPNHFSTLGTTGGPISALNTNALKNSDFYTGAFPAEYGNATAAVFDINFRTGNTTKHERTLQLNLFSGLEAMLEGPLSKKKNGASYLVGYRYSFVQIGQSLGLNVGTAAVPRYQDWVYNIQFAKTKAGRLSLFGMGGISNIDFIGKDIDSTDFYSRSDQDTYVKSNFSLFGAKHTLDIGKQTFIRTVVSYSRTKTDFNNYQYELPVPPYTNRWLITDVNDEQETIRFNSIINSKTSAKFSWRAGITGERFQINSLASDREGKTASDAFDVIRNYNDQFLLWQYFAQARYKPINKITITAGVHGMNLTFNKSNILEPRAAISYQPNVKNTITFSYGLHGQMQALPVYLYQKQVNGLLLNNRNLDFSKAHHFVLGYENRFAANWRVKAELYYQSLYDIPVEAGSTGFSMLNAGSDFTFPEKAGLINEGTGSNTGVELTVEKFLTNGFYLMATGSLFDSKYKGSDGIERNSSFNYGYAANVLTGREWKTGKDKRNAFTVDVRLSTIGGRYVTPVDVTRSQLEKREVLDESRYNSEQLNSYLRIDTKFGYRINSKKRKISQTFYLDLQNVSNRENIFLRRYNPQRGTVGNVNQIGFFPDVLYRIQF